MSQSGITDPARESDWDTWYVKHLAVMASVPGVGSAQRFKTSTPTHSPSLAMYSVVSADVFKDPYYLSVRGMGEWLALIDWRYYKRNLFAGADHAPEVNACEVLLVADREAPDASLQGEWTWLECVGIDRSTAFRGIAVVDAQRARNDHGDAVAIYRPTAPASKPPRP